MMHVQKSEDTIKGLPYSEEKLSLAGWHALDKDEVLQKLGADAARGLETAEAARRLEEHGPNVLEERELKSPWRILWEQITSAMVLILIGAAIISALLGDMTDATAILVIVVLNAALGVRQEFKAEKAIAALKALSVPTVRVRRNGATREISARELVPGDIVLIETGNLIPADGRLLKSHNLRIQEAALTGESEPVEKDHEPVLGEGAPLAEHLNMVYLGTMVTYGRATAVVTQTGMNTQIGHIASMIQTVAEEATPLQRRLEHLGRTLAVAALFLVAVIFSLGMLRGGEIRQMFLVAISMAVAAVPEGLPAVVTIALALGSQRMLKRNALIRKLPAVETLGSVTVICSDKTGTLTQNRMTVTILDVAGQQVNLKTDLDGRRPCSCCGTSPLDFLDCPPALVLLLMGGALCNDAVMEREEGDSEADGLEAVGDPTETALLVAAARMGFEKSRMEHILPRIGEVPFDSERKLMTTLHRLEEAQNESAGAFKTILGAISDEASRATPEGASGAVPEGRAASHFIFSKGGVDSVLSISGSVLEGKSIQLLSDGWRRRVLESNDKLATKGMRVLGVAYRTLASPPADHRRETLERDAVFLGVIGMIDPARPEAKNAVGTCKTAGIRPVMITGDHPLTARHIAQDLGIVSDGRILTGRDLSQMSREQLEDVVDEVDVYARVSPEHKLRIVDALKNRGHIVAMTGDRVNDAPALKKADIGVAMGITGTDVTKQVADMVLLDDNFATIVAAVEEGRVIYDNIRKFMKYLLTTNSGELYVMLLAPFLGMPLPLLPLQILWINLVTDGLPALALGVEPAEPDVMRRRPHRPDESIFARGLGRHVLWVGLVMGLVPLLTGYWYWHADDPTWQTMVFTILTFAQMSHALAIRSDRHSLFRIGIFSNKPLLGAVMLTTVLQMALIYVPFLQTVFHTAPLPAGEMLLCIALSTSVFWAVEGEKWLIRRSGS
jgi:Ca2+-transporting ATPase